MPKQRIHNEWFQPIVKTSCLCGAKNVEMFAWGEYSNGKWHSIAHFCRGCFAARVLSRLIAHAKPCGCSFQFKARTGHKLPDFIAEAQGQCNVQA